MHFLHLTKANSNTCKRVIFLVCWLFVFPFCTKAQNTIHGVVSDSTLAGIEFVAVTLRKDSSVVVGAFTDSLGNYSISIPGTGNYSLFFTAYGFKTRSLDLGVKSDTTININLYEEVTNYGEVQVTAKIPIVEKRIDRLVYNPSVLASNRGTNVYDVLKRTPTVTADEGGNLSIKGISGARVMIDGRLLQMSNEQVMDYLKSIPSDEIYKIEIISNPSSKYDAEGVSGLVNILLERNQRKGIVGNINAAYGQAYYPNGSFDLNFNYRSEKINFFGGTSLRLGRDLLQEDVQNIYNRQASPYNYFENGRRVRDELSNFSRLGCDFFLGKRHTLGVRLEYSLSKQNSARENICDFYALEDLIDSTYYSYIDQKSSYNTYSSNLNYVFDIDSSGQSLSIDLDYLYYDQPLRSASTRTDLDSMGTFFKDDVVFKNEAEQRISIYSGKLDYYKPIGSKSSIEFGGKYYRINTENDLSFYDFYQSDWQQNDTKSSRFLYDESSIAGYLSFSHQFTKSFSGKVGLRNEYTTLKGSQNETEVNFNRNYNRLFPTVFLQYSKNENHQISLSYVQRINRPDYSNLSPFRYYLSPNSYVVGDPFLQPAFTHSFELSYLLKQNYYFSLYTNITNGQITQAFLLDDETNSYKTISMNLDQSYSYGLSVYFGLGLFDWWYTTLNLNAGVNGVSTSIVDGADYSRQNFNVFVFNTNQFTLSKKGKLSLESTLMYQPGGMTQGIFVLGRMLDFSVHLKKTFKNNKAAISLSGLDLFNSAYVTAKVDDESQYSFISGSYNKRGVRLTFSYKFGKKDIESQRNKTDSNEQEKDRL